MKVRWVAELHDMGCTFCDANRGTNPQHVVVAIWRNVEWISGANPPGPPDVCICRECFEMAHVGPLVQS
jgi:hypothetical protein